MGEERDAERRLAGDREDGVNVATRRIGNGLNPGRKSRKVLQDCTICVFCRSTGHYWTVTRKRENRKRLAGRL